MSISVAVLVTTSAFDRWPISVFHGSFQDLDASESLEGSSMEANNRFQVARPTLIGITSIIERECIAIHRNMQSTIDERALRHIFPTLG